MALLLGGMFSSDTSQLVRVVSTQASEPRAFKLQQIEGHVWRVVESARVGIPQWGVLTSCPRGPPLPPLPRDSSRQVLLIICDPN